MLAVATTHLCKVGDRYEAKIDRKILPIYYDCRGVFIIRVSVYPNHTIAFGLQAHTPSPRYIRPFVGRRVRLGSGPVEHENNFVLAGRVRDRKPLPVESSASV